MAKDGPTPLHCKTDIFKNGKQLCVATGNSQAAEQWVRTIARQASTRVDWHYFGGRVNVLHLGDDASRQRAIAKVKELASQLNGQVISIDGIPFDRNDSTTQAGTDNTNSSSPGSGEKKLSHP